MTVPKRRPPSPHSCNWSRSPLRQWAAAKPSHVMNPNSAMNTINAVQFTSCTAIPPNLVFLCRSVVGAGCEVHDCRQNGADDHADELIPVEERYSPKRWLNRVVERRP